MSFSMEFYAKSREDANFRVNSEYAVPECVKQFLFQALSGINGAVHVKVWGHLFSGKDFARSNCEITVTPIAFVPATPPAPVEAAAKLSKAFDVIGDKDADPRGR